MKNNDDRMWSAYLDTELSVTEVESLEKHLSEEDLEHLEREKHLDSKISEHLKKGVKCPEALWNSVCQQIESEKKLPEKKHLKLFYVLVSAVAAAIVFAFIWQPQQSDYMPLSVIELEQSSKVTELAAVNELLSAKGISLELGDVAQPGHHTKRLLGAGVELVAGEEVVTLLFECCGKPVKILVLPKNSKAQRIVAKSSSGVVASVNNYQLALFSKHSTPELFKFIKPLS